MEFQAVLFLLGFILAAVLVYGEVKRDNKQRLVWRILAEVIAVVSILFILSPPRYSASLSRPGEISVVAKGALMDSIYVSLNNKNPIYVADLSYFLNEHPEITKINILGYGLNKSTLKRIKNYRISFKPSEIPSGFVSCRWTKIISYNEPLIVQGSYLNRSSKTVKVLLKGFGKNLDSAQIKAAQTAQFSLSDVPVQSGKAVFELIALQGSDTLSKELIPFEVEEARVLNVVILAAFPDFEYKFLKAWLYKESHHVILRNKISKDKYSFDFLNTKANSLEINSALLNKTDLLIADEEELDALNAGERAVVSKALAKGMGLFARLSRKDQLPKSPLINQLSRYEFTGRKSPLQVVLPGVKARPVSIDSEQNLFLKPGENGKSIVTDEKGKILVGSSLSGNGKVTASTLAATYGWMLTGKSTVYNKFWSTVISGTARSLTARRSISYSPLFPKRRGTMHFIVQEEEADLPGLIFDGARLAVRQNMELPYQWDMYYWPSKEGWNTASDKNGDFSFFVYKPQDWLTSKAVNSVKSTKMFLSLRIGDVETKNAVQIKEKRVPIFVFFVLFVLSVGFLWAESRIFTEKSN